MKNKDFDVILPTSFNIVLGQTNSKQSNPLTKIQILTNRTINRPFQDVLATIVFNKGQKEDSIERRLQRRTGLN